MKFWIIFFCVGLAKIICSDEIFTKANNQFTAKVFSTKVKEISKFNFVLSTFSALTPLALLALASEGESHDELLETLGFPNDNSVKTSFQTLKNDLNAISKVHIKIANRLYVSTDIKLDQSVNALSTSAFSTDVKSVDFQNRVKTAGDINKWIDKQTNGRITEMVSSQELSADIRAMIVDTIYFKGRWKTPFDKKQSILGDFYLDKYNTTKLNFMTVRGYSKYGENKQLDAKLLEMAYEGEEATFLIVLPNNVDGLQDLISKLREPSALATAVSEMSLHNVKTLLPKFKIETETDLKEILLQLNVSRLFNPSTAKLYHLSQSTPPLYLSSAIQRTFIEIDEDGTEAAAASKYGITFLNSAIRPLTKFYVDHPFVFYVMFGSNILFSGVFQSPN